MDIKLAFGKTGLDVSLDDALVSAVFRKKQMPRVADEKAAMAEAMANPRGCPPLREIAAGKKTACIVINDITRPVPNKLILPFIIEELRAAGLADADICLLNATGTHRPADKAEQAELVGEDILARHPFHNHDCHNDGEHRYLGAACAGTEVWIDTRYLDADVKILTGLIEPHFMAGYSGGRKVICPGIASIRSVSRIHHPVFMEAKRASNCVLDDNPLHRELIEISRMAGCDFIVNVVIDEDRKLCGAFCGDIEAAHRAGASFASQYDRVDARERYDVVVTSSAGYPLDKTFYQAVKGICGVTGILAPGGTIIIAAECSEGMGNDSFVEGLRLRSRFDNHAEYVKLIEKPENFAPDQWQVEKLSQALDAARVKMYSPNLSEKDFSLTFTERIDSIESGIELCLQKLGPAAKIAIVPEGPYVIPFLKGA